MPEQISTIGSIVRGFLAAIVCTPIAHHAIAQQKNAAPNTATQAERGTGIQTPALIPLAPAQLFANGFEYFKQGKFADAEALFLAGLSKDDQDPRAWEWLARSQGALGKDADADHSLQEAVKRGLPKEREEKARIEIFYAFPVSLPPEFDACFSQMARQTIQRVRGPRMQRAFELEYLSPQNYLIREMYEAVAPSLFLMEKTSQFGSEQPFTYTSLVYLGGIVNCSSAEFVESVSIRGTIFPLRAGNKFIVEYVKRSRGGNASTAHQTTHSCVVMETAPASPKLIPTHPTEGTITKIMCDFERPHNYQKFKTTLFFSSHLGTFIHYHPVSEKYAIKVRD